MGLTFENEEGEDSRYPLEDLLDKYFIHIEEVVEEKNNVFKAIVGGNLKNLNEIKSVFGKRVYNEDYIDNAGQTRVKLIIE